MNIKCLLYARYSTSMFIHCINKDTDNSSLTNDAEKVD